MKVLMRCTEGGRDTVVDAQCDPKAIKARTEVGRARRNANGNLLHR